MISILLVDDSRFMRMWLTRLLSQANYHVIGEAENGESAVHKFKVLRPSIIIMDINMPQMDGLTALEKINSIDPSAKIIMCSSIGQQSHIIESIKRGAKDFIVKPYFSNLIPIIENIISADLKPHQANGGLDKG